VRRGDARGGRRRAPGAAHMRGRRGVAAGAASTSCCVSRWQHAGSTPTWVCEAMHDVSARRGKDGPDPAAARRCTPRVLPAVTSACGQVCDACVKGGDVPDVVAAAWLLVDEYVLSEAARSLLKVLATTDALLEALPPAPLRPAEVRRVRGRVYRSLVPVEACTWVHIHLPAD